MLQKKIILSLMALLMVAFFLTSCDQLKPNQEKVTSADEVVNADIAFSDMSRQLGMKKAFMEYIGNDGVLLRPDYLPIVGADAIDFLSQINDTTFKLTWTPTKGGISKSGDLGYTYGVYELTTADTILKGTYVNVWKKQSDGAWKFIVDSGNPGISSNEP
jgi:ketosteroid isomerase-like protein